MKKSISLFAGGSFGDYLILTAVLPPLKYSGHSIRVVALPEFAVLLEGHPLIDQFVVLPEDGNYENPFKYADDYFGCTTDCIGTNEYWVHNDMTHNSTHVIDRICENLQIPTGSREISIHLPQEALEWGKQYSDYVLIHTQPAVSPYKKWPTEYWEALVAKIKNELGLQTLQIGYPDGTTIPDAPFLQAPTIKHVIAAIKYSRLFIGLDSVFNHATQAIRKPSIILWASTDPMILGYDQNVNMVNGTAWKQYMGRNAPLLKCQPCFFTRFHIAAGIYCANMLPQTINDSVAYIPACMSGNTVDAVFGQVVAMLEKSEIYAAEKVAKRSIPSWVE